MTTTRWFRYLWRVNAIVILLAGLGVCGLLGWIVIDRARSFLKTRTASDIVSPSDPTTGWWLGEFREISGANRLAAPVRASQSFETGYRDKDTSSVRNYLFVNPEDKSSRWLVPDNSRLILEMHEVVDERLKDVPRQKKPVLFLLLHVVVRDSDGDGRLTRSDLMTLAVANPDGSGYAEVLDGIGSVLSTKQLAPDRILTAYAAGSRYFIAELNLEQRKVIATKELPPLGVK